MENKKIISITSLLIALTLVLCVFFTGCSGKDSDEKSADENTTVSTEENEPVQDQQQAEDPEDANSPASPTKKPTMPTGYVSKYKHYQVKISDTNQFNIFLRYREGSASVADITGYIKYPADTENLDAVVAEDNAFGDRVEALGVSNSATGVGCSKSYDGTATCHFSFYDLDVPGNEALAQLASEYTDLLLEADNTFNIANCEKQLLEAGFELTDSN